MAERKLKRANIDWILQVPETWDIKPNKYVMKKVKDIAPIYKGEDIISLSMDGVIVRDLEAGGKMPATFNGYQRVYKDNLLMCLFDYDVTPRCIGLIKNEGVTSPAYSQFKMLNGNYAPYYYYYYLMIDNKKELLHLAKNLRHSFTEEQLGMINTPVPPVSEQKQIADFLDSKCSELDSLAKDIEHQIEILEEYKKSVITEAVTKGLDPDVPMKDSGVEWIGMIPNHWNVDRGKYIFKNKKTIVGAKVDDYDRLALTLKGVIKRSKDDNEGLQPTDFSGYQILKANELVFKLIDLKNVSTSRVGLSQYDGIVSPAYIVLETSKKVYPSFAEKYYLMMWMQEVFNALGDAGVRSNLNSKDLLEIRFPLPPYDEQVAIANFLDSKCNGINTIIKNLENQINILEEYKKSLIYEYVTGKKEVL